MWFLLLILAGFEVGYSNYPLIRGVMASWNVSLFSCVVSLCFLEVHVKFIAHILLQVLRLHNGESDIEMEKLRMPLLLFL
jgi:hypothetical protein